MKDEFVGKSFRVMNASVKHGFELGTGLKVTHVYTFDNATDGSKLYAAIVGGSGILEDVSETFLKKACTQLKPEVKSREEALAEFIDTYGPVTEEDIHFGIEGYYQLNNNKAIQWMLDSDYNSSSLYLIKALASHSSFKVEPLFNETSEVYMTNVTYEVNHLTRTAYVKREQLKKYCEKIEEREESV